jgi:chromosome segregation ATPase
VSEPDIDLVELGQRIKTLEDQLKSLAERLSRAELQLKELEAEREGGWKKFSDP